MCGRGGCVRLIVAPPMQASMQSSADFPPHSYGCAKNALHKHEHDHAEHGNVCKFEVINSIRGECVLLSVVQQRFLRHIFSFVACCTFCSLLAHFIFTHTHSHTNTLTSYSLKWNMFVCPSAHPSLRLSSFQRRRRDRRSLISSGNFNFTAFSVSLALIRKSSFGEWKVAEWKSRW